MNTNEEQTKEEVVVIGAKQPEKNKERENDLHQNGKGNLQTKSSW